MKITGDRGKQAGHPLKNKTPRNSVRWFSLLMETGLALKDHEKDWIDERLDMLFGKIQTALYSLFFGIHIHTENIGKNTEKKIIDLCVEIANSAMMIADQVKRKTK